MTSTRLVYLDCLRGLAVLIMVQSHVFDAWTQAEDRQNTAFYTAVFIGGLGAPLFLFLAGVAIVLSAYARSRSAENSSAGTRVALLRGGEVFVLAWLFRLQAQLLGWGPLANLLRVDILNVMGLSMMAAGALWGSGRQRQIRIILFAAATVVVTMLTPIIRALPHLAVLPDPLEAYLRPAGRYAQFTLFPWGGFLLAGALVGELIDASRTPGRERRIQIVLLVTGAAGALVAWWASLQATLYPAVSFWASSPAFFFIRLGIVTALVPAGWAHCRFWLGARATATTEPDAAHGTDRAAAMVAFTRALETFGRSSLFVYWIHVEMVYGLAAEPVKRALPLWGSLVATAMLCMVLYRIVRWKNRRLQQVRLPRSMRIFAAVLR